MILTLPLFKSCSRSEALSSNLHASRNTSSIGRFGGRPGDILNQFSAFKGVFSVQHGPGIVVAQNEMLKWAMNSASARERPAKEEAKCQFR